MTESTNSTKRISDFTAELEALTDTEREIMDTLEALEDEYNAALGDWLTVCDDHRAAASVKTSAYERLRSVLLKLSAVTAGTHTVSYARGVSSRISAPARREITRAVDQAAAIFGRKHLEIARDIASTEEILAGVQEPAEGEAYLRRCHEYRAKILGREIEAEPAPAERTETDDLADAARALGIEIRDVSAELVAAGYSPAAAEIKKHADATTRVELTQAQAERLARIVNAGGAITVDEAVEDDPGTVIVLVKGRPDDTPSLIALTAAGEIVYLDRADEARRPIACAAAGDGAEISVPIEPDDDPDPDPHGAPIASVIAAAWVPTWSRRRAKGAGRPEWRPLNAREHAAIAEAADVHAFRGSYVLAIDGTHGYVIKTSAAGSPLRVLDVRLTPEILAAFGVDLETEAPAGAPSIEEAAELAIEAITHNAPIHSELEELLAERWTFNANDAGYNRSAIGAAIDYATAEYVRRLESVPAELVPILEETKSNASRNYADLISAGGRIPAAWAAAVYDVPVSMIEELEPAAATAARLGVRRRSVQDWARAGKIPGAVQTPGGHWLIPKTWTPAGR